MQPDATRIANIVTAAGAQPEVETTSLGVLMRIPADSVHDVLNALKAEGFGFLVDLFGTDTGEQIEMTYHLRDFGRDEEVYVRSSLPYDGALRSVWDVYPAAAFPEREAAELLGMRLDCHPNPRRLVTTEGCPPYLRKEVPVRGAEEVRLR
ncbi:MAG: NADH-quinone oxidoreductase subunit C [Coriobacteriales bacterium]|nr:NADH-quinone oxidoreductase subunit C [Coriobacteriales bacterium]